MGEDGGFFSAMKRPGATAKITRGISKALVGLLHHETDSANTIPLHNEKG